jgi:hypothetical protein
MHDITTTTTQEIKVKFLKYALLLGLSLAVSLPARAQLTGYNYIFVASAGGPSTFSSLGLPALNNSSDVAFTATFVNNGSQIIKKGQPNALTTVAQTGTTYSAFGPNVALNNKGEVAFRAAFKNGNGEGGIFVANGTQHIVRSYGAFDHISDPLLNENSTTAHRLNNSHLIAAFPAYQVINTSGIFSDFVTAPSLNNFGAVAFLAGLDAGGRAIYRCDFKTPTVEIANNSGIWSRFLHHSINESGDVAFSALLDAGGQGLFKSSGGSITSLMSTNDPNSPFASAGVCVIDLFGTVAFGATLKSGGSGVYIALPTPTGMIYQTVLQTGMKVFGATVQSVQMGRDGYDSSKFALWVQLTSGAQVILRADPW